ncbi:ABC transporter substrate-binding protein [Brevibacterium ravenspurgense]|uniref:ABC transporter substrate-binding protein n=2 Tax=Micrococcales TaxID=85006 RepID=A0A2I1IH53_9MICO|nr:MULTISPECIES: ABC transporter substrate-binding protein [Micrococcales]KGF21753.1 ABC transporter substrate-binding protein [Pseudoglutamicibacter albus DNF00011]MCG7304324.1 ABC transporter substrate-binding protein [Pseudoglutamicibacter albus]PKY70456.1 ABC transporter substrate-binding protein [Brevibacterium ravenspurgense]
MSRSQAKPSRILSTICVVLTISLFAASCSAKPESDNATRHPEQASLLPAAEQTTSYPLTLESPFGETVLPERPERIAAVAPTAIDTELLLALGVTPILTSSLVSEGGYLDDHGAAEIETYEFVSGEDIPIETIAASDPDFIVAVGWTDGLSGVNLGDYYDRLTSIAPVLTSPDTSSQQLIPWQDSIRLLGSTLDLEDAATQVIAHHQEHFAEIRKKHPEFAGLTTSWVLHFGAANSLRYMSPSGSGTELFLSELGFIPNPKADQFVGDPWVSNELLTQIDADVLLLGQTVNASDEEMHELVTENTLFMNLGAVMSGHLVQLTPKTEDNRDLLWTVTVGGPIGQEWAADYLVPRIADVLTKTS